MPLSTTYMTVCVCVCMRACVCVCVCVSAVKRLITSKIQGFVYIICVFIIPIQTHVCIYLRIMFIY